MKWIKLILTFLLAIFLISSGLNHFINPAFYDGFIPNFLPKLQVNYLAGLVEVILGLGLFIPQSRKRAAQGTMILMLLFLPIHIWDLLRDPPAIGSRQAALIRIPVQFVFIAWAWWVSRPIKSKAKKG